MISSDAFINFLALHWSKNNLIIIGTHHWFIIIIMLLAIAIATVLWFIYCNSHQVLYFFSFFLGNEKVGSEKVAAAALFSPVSTKKCHFPGINTPTITIFVHA